MLLIAKSINELRRSFRMNPFLQKDDSPSPAALVRINMVGNMGRS